MTESIHQHTMAERGDELLAQGAAEIERWLEQHIKWPLLPDHLANATRYSVLAGGKRLRPVLVMTACESIGGRRDAAMPAAAAIELIHCFSLVHDDLPALDNDDMRRGRATLHVHAGEPMAILAGDLMLAMAFGLLSDGEGPPQSRISMVGALAEGTADMVAGQVYDTLGGLPEALTPLAQVQLVHRNKTGALIRAACRMGGMAGGANDDQLAALTAYGNAMGLMFQIVDDVLDLTQSAQHVGKATGKDQASGKLTYPGTLGIDGCREEVERLRVEANDAAACLGNGGHPLACLAEVMAIRTR